MSHICEPPFEAAEAEAVTVSLSDIFPLSSASVTSKRVIIFVTEAG